MASLRLEAIGHLFMKPVDLEIDAGELVFLSGPSGSGKSLLLRAVADLDPHQGEAWLGSESRSGLSPPVWRRRVGLLPAESFWWAERVGEHLPGGDAETAKSKERLSDWLAQLGFDLDVLDWEVARLSTGERQRLALIRLLTQNPEALLLDEATANLDPANRDQVERLIHDYRRSATAAVLWVSHDPAQRQRLATRAYVIQDGALVSEP
ncbi:ATP-binding cassette domain-containing protein [Thiorhodococcus mannitoliphagus]|uniref:ATP-binding cassette domain-containing protein n=1 Tax=Thiorhodococcus mannitoliphagus TaxID=329406 RepID=A0A6P1E0B2_9GAMM|nr:ATP-binding cassette domain-containing protein [Thiorhodococcus mannitoliphagus]NEX21434.1 ATP-binding cassette domain-containing protein [Thiorhodococcus mannitoliphagus]